MAEDTSAVLGKKGTVEVPLETRKWYLPSLKTASQSLAQIIFTSLIRPNVAKNAPPTLDLVYWGIQMYSFSLLSHYREMLRSFLLLTDRGNIPAAFVIARCLFEMGAHAYYVNKHVQQYLKQGKLKLAWEFLSEINMGNLYMKEKYAERDDEGDNPNFPAPREIGKVIRCFNEFGNIKHAGKIYSYLSEYSHPNMGAFSSHWKFNDDGRTIKLNFTESPRNPLMAPLPEVSISLAALNFVGELLALTDETEVRSCIKSVVRKHVKSRELSST